MKVMRRCYFRWYNSIIGETLLIRYFKFQRRILKFTRVNKLFTKGAICKELNFLIYLSMVDFQQINIKKAEQTIERVRNINFLTHNLGLYSILIIHFK